MPADEASGDRRADLWGERGRRSIGLFFVDWGEGEGRKRKPPNWTLIFFVFEEGRDGEKYREMDKVKKSWWGGLYFCHWEVHLRFFFLSLLLSNFYFIYSVYKFGWTSKPMCKKKKEFFWNFLLVAFNFYKLCEYCPVIFNVWSINVYCYPITMNNNSLFNSMNSITNTIVSFLTLYYGDYRKELLSLIVNFRSESGSFQSIVQDTDNFPSLGMYRDSDTYPPPSTNNLQYSNAVRII